MAGDPSNLLPHRWAPGTSGNPRGYSDTRRVAKRVRQALDAILAEQVPDWLVETLPPNLAAELPDGVTFAELVALRLVLAASSTPKPQVLLEVARLIVAAQSKADALERPEPTRPPKLVATEDQRRAVAAELGVELDPPPAAPDAELH